MVDLLLIYERLTDSLLIARAQVKVQRFDVFLTPEAERLVPARAPQASLWLPGALERINPKEGVGPGQHPLALYGIRSKGAIRQGKSLADPERTAAFEARRAQTLRGPKPCIALRRLALRGISLLLQRTPPSCSQRT